MARISSRGRSRGGRILDTPPLVIPGVGHGRGVGRGIFFSPVNTHNERPGESSGPGAPDLSTFSLDDTNTEEECKKSLEDHLSQFQTTGEGCFIHIALSYFAKCDDVQYFMDKVMESILKNDEMLVKFTMSFRLITLLKSHGEQIKLKMFSKLQTTFQDMVVLMKDNSNLSDVEREGVRNFCELLGQLYFRFRLTLDSLERYNVLAAPTIECMTYLVTSGGHQELVLLIKLIVLNYSALCILHQEKMDQLALEIHVTLVKEEDRVKRAWLLCALDLMNFHQSELPQHLVDFYIKELGMDWLDNVPESPIQMLADIPADVISNQMDKFNVLVEDYNKHRLVAL